MPSNEEESHEHQEMTVFISYAREDFLAAKNLYEELKAKGLNPWLDKKNILPGQDWEKEIERAIKRSRYFVALFSSTSVKKIGYVQNEFKFALEVFRRYPRGEIFFIPARLDDCKISYEELASIHHADLFPDDNAWKEGVNQILEGIFGEIRRNAKQPVVAHPSTPSTTVNESHSQEPSKPPTTPEPSNTVPYSRRNTKFPILVLAVLATVVGAVLIVAILYVYQFPHSPGPSAIDQNMVMASNTPAKIKLAGTDPTPDANLTAFVATPPKHGKLGPINQTTGNVLYTPSPGYTGVDSFTFKVNDGKLDSSNVGVVKITINGLPPHPHVVPIAIGKSTTTSVNEPVTIKLRGYSDQANVNLAAKIVTPPKHGTLGPINQTTGNVLYTPSPGYTGVDSFTFKVNDGKVDSKNIANVSIKINAVK